MPPFLPRARTVVLAASLAAALAGPVAATAAAPATAARNKPPSPSTEREVLYDLLDATRAEHGLAPLRRDPAVEAVAESWSGVMAEGAGLVHNTGIRAQLPPGTRTAENVGRGDRGRAARLHAAWLASPSHRATMLSPAHDAVGIGVVHDGRVLWATLNVSAAPRR